MANYVLTIAGVTMTGTSHSFIGQSLSITSGANGRSTLTLDILSQDGSYIPALDAACVLTENGTAIFGGTVSDVVTTGAGTRPVVPITSRVTITDNNGLADQRYAAGTLPAGTLKAALQAIVTNYLAIYGVSLDPAQVTGPSLPALTYDYTKLADILNQSVTLGGGGYIWEIDASLVLRMYLIGSVAAPFNVVDGDGHQVRDVSVQSSRVNSSRPYANRVIVRGGSPAVPITAQADDAGEQAAHNLWEIVVASPTATDTTTATALANELLIQYTTSPKTVKYQTTQTGLKVGMAQTITKAARGINATCLIADISTVVEKGVLVHTVTAITGSVYQGSWRDVYKQWSSSIAQVVAIPATAGPGRQAFFLGGSAIEYVSAGAPAWVPVDGTAADPGMQVTLDTSARGSAAATVTARLRARSGTVQCRLRDVSNNLVVGTSSVVSSATFQTVTFTVALTAGAFIYQLELLGSVANAQIAGIGTLS